MCEIFTIKTPHCEEYDIIQFLTDFKEHHCALDNDCVFKLQEQQTILGNTTKVMEDRKNFHIFQTRFTIHCEELDEYCRNHNLVLNRTFELLMYKEGSRFHKHIDKIKHIPNLKHTHTVLIYPNIEHYEGGTFIWYDRNNTEHKIEISNMYGFTLIIMPLGILHEVETITYGTRYVFKSKLYSMILNSDT